MSNLEEVREGRVRLLVPRVGVPSKKSPVFYNPEMKFSRNISVACLSVFAKESAEVCDAMCATGAAGIRYRVEAGCEVRLNDRNPEAVRLAVRNLELNGLPVRKSGRLWKGPGITVSNEDANLLLNSESFSVVDLDPFGSPANFLNAAAKSVLRRGMLCVTATDTSVSTHPRSALKKYGIPSLKKGHEKPEYYPELGLRIVLSSIILSCARYGKRFEPLLCFSKRHFFRFFGKISGAPSEILKKFGYVSHCFSCGNRFVGPESRCSCGSRTEITGPLYLGPTFDRDFSRKVAGKLKEAGFREESAFVELVSKEVGVPLFYSLHELSSRIGRKSVSMEKMLQALEERGFRCSRTHASPVGFKTDASRKEVLDTFAAIGN